MPNYTVAFDRAVDHAMKFEVGGFWNLETQCTRDGTNKKACGYVNDPVDPGGETKFGIAKNANPDVDVTNLTWEDAKAIYFTRYWLAGSCDKLPTRIAVLHFDGCINHGVSRASKFLQISASVGVDGVIGPQTINAIRAVDSVKACNTICDKREKFYRDIVAAKPSQGKFLNGWLRRINEMRVFTTNPSNNFN